MRPSMDAAGTSPPPDDDDDTAARTSGRRAAWKRLTWPDRIAIWIALAVIAAVTVPQLPPGICYSDGGDLQLASATLGIAHPPGYAGYVSLGYLLTRVPGVDPAYLVSLACLASGIVAIWLCMLMQVRLGGNAWLAAAIGMALTGQPRVWQNLAAPEVYVPSLALMSGSAYLLLKYARIGRRRDLVLAALLFGVVAGNRPPVVFALPFFAMAWLTVRRRWDGPWRRSVASMVLAALCLILPGVYSLGYLWVRDRPTTAYNYIEQYHTKLGELPPIDGGPRAKAERVWWLAKGEQFRYLMGNDWSGIKSKLRWLRGDLGLEAPATLVAVPALILLGMVLAARRCGQSAWLLGGMIVQPLIFICWYRIYGQAADLLPLVWAGAVACGVGVSPLLALASGRTRHLAGGVVLATACAWTAVCTGERRNEAEIQDATGFVNNLELATFPQDAVIFSGWGKLQPLWYAREVLTDREDIDVVNVEHKWWPMIEPYLDRPVFLTETPRMPEGFELASFRNLWRLERGDPAAD